MLTPHDLHVASLRRQHHNRIAELVAQVIEAEDGAPVSAVTSLIGVAGLMARYLPMPTRITIANRMEFEAAALRGLVSVH